ncbi:aspartate-semialdehyde dehydrogenase [Ferrimicrobium sp.]|uniref:aspartate-semialdehyde dehydrogenase n=1 Tax=Ferrimicrobium sp. TaxID=2926050 RepID=UPI002608466A|nr:aspartate-semialdehyde dehydrogenase [Ferrimicrobium sp.]
MRSAGTLAVVGATGQVGGVMRQILKERQVPFDHIRFFASPRSAGVVIEFSGRLVAVEDVETADLRGVDYAIFSIGATASKVHAPRFVEAGAVVIDNSSAYRMDPEVPLVVPEVNPREVHNRPHGIIANPNCTTMIAMPPLAIIDRLFGLERVIASTYQAASGAGREGVAELDAELQRPNLAALTFDGGAVDFMSPAKFPAVLAGNVIPLAGDLHDGDTSEEEKFVNESRKILGLADLRCHATCVRVPVFTGHSIAIVAECRDTPQVAELVDALKQEPGCQIVELPTPLASAGVDPVLIGRIRPDHSSTNGIAFFVAGDNLRKGAALNAIQILELLLQ